MHRSMAAALLLVLAPVMAASEVTNVREVGAKGNGKTDDSRAIQAAIERVGPGGGVFFPPGTYLVRQPIRLRSRLRLSGAGPSASVLRYTGKGPALLTGTNVRDIHIADLALQGTRSEPEAEENGGLALRVSEGGGEVPLRLTVEGVWVSGFRSTGIVVLGTGKSVATDVTIRDCRFTDLGLHGVLGYFARRYHVEHCRFERLGRSGTIFPRCRDVTVRDCSVRTTGWHGIEVGDETEGFLIHGNVVEDSGDHAGILVEQAAHRGAITDNRVVAPRFCGIQLNNKHAAAAVKEVTVRGNFVDMRENVTRPALIAYGDTTYTVDDCIIEGNTLLGGQTGIEAHYLKRCRIAGNLVRGAKTRGIDLFFLTQVGITRNTVADCQAEGIRVQPYAEVFTNTEVNLAGNQVYAPAAGVSDAAGILVRALRGGSVRGNHVAGFGQGIRTELCEQVTASENDVRE